MTNPSDKISTHPLQLGTNRPLLRQMSAARWAAARHAVILSLLLSVPFCGRLAMGQTPPTGKDTSQTAPPLKELLPRLKPRTPPEAIRSFRLDAGLAVELVAAEPNVADPVAIAFDEQGRLYVAELSGYPDPFVAPQGAEPLGKVRLLTDGDGDGLYETSHVFADRLNWPSGVACWRGGVFVAAAPDIWYLKDEDGDGRADLKQRVFTGFGVQQPYAMLNTLLWGFDNRIHGASSYNGGSVRRPGQPDSAAVALGGRDFCFDPFRLELRAVSGNGEFGNAFDDWGNRFVCNAGTMILHGVLPARYLSRNPHLGIAQVQRALVQTSGRERVFPISPPEPWKAVRAQFWERWVNTSHDFRAARFPATELAPAGFVTALSGVTIYRGTALPREYQGNAFVGETANNLVRRLILKPSGVSFTAEPVTPDQREFLASTDNWFRPVNFANGPDGCLYVVDMYREVIEDRSAIPEEIQQHIGMTSGRERGRIYRVVPRGFRRPAPPRLGGATTAELVAALDHPDSWPRETAQRLLVERQEKAAALRIAPLAATGARPQSRLTALWTLAGLGQLSEAMLLQSLRDPDAVVRAHAVRLSEEQLARSARLPERVLACAADADPRVRFQAALTLSGWESESVAPALADLLRRDANDIWLRTAALLAAGPHAARVLAQIAQNDKEADRQAAAAVFRELAQLIGARNRAAELADALKTVERLADDEQAEAVINGLGEGLRQAGRALSEVLEREGAAASAALLQPRFDAAARRALDANQSLEKRMAALELLGHATFATAARPLTLGLAPRHPPALQAAALAALGRHSDARVGKLLVEHWRGFTPNQRREVAELLFRNSNRLRHLLDALESNSIAAADLDPARRQALLEHADSHVRRRARALFAKELAGDRQRVVAQYRSALKLTGNTERGAQLFTKHCATCHQIAGKGTNVGPDLATAQNLSAEAVLGEILDPNRQVQPNYFNYTVTTTDGSIVTGIVVAETETSVTLRRAEGAQDTILRSHIDTMASTRLSLMPEGLEKDLNPQQLADLIAYVGTLKNAPKTPAQ